MLVVKFWSLMGPVEPCLAAKLRVQHDSALCAPATRKPLAGQLNLACLQTRQLCPGFSDVAAQGTQQTQYRSGAQRKSHSLSSVSGLLREILRAMASCHFTETSCPALCEHCWRWQRMVLCYSRIEAIARSQTVHLHSKRRTRTCCWDLTWKETQVMQLAKLYLKFACYAFSHPSLCACMTTPSSLQAVPGMLMTVVHLLHVCCQ